MTNEELVSEIQQGGENVKSLMDELCRNNYGLVVSTARHFRSAEKLDDLIQEGFIGLMDAARCYDPEKGASFSTYATIHIRKAIYGYFRECGHIFRLPPEIAALLTRFFWIQEAYKKRYGEEIDRKTAAALLRIPEKKAATIMRIADQCNAASLYARIENGEGTELQDFIQDPESENGFEEIMDEETRRKVWEVIDTLPDAQSAVLRQKYQQNASLEEIGSTMGLSSWQVRTIHENAIRTLREGRRGRLLWELQSGAAYHGSGLSEFRHTQTSVQERIVMRIEDAAAR